MRPSPPPGRSVAGRPGRPAPAPDADRVGGHRHGLARAGSALVRRDPVPRVDPLRTHRRAGAAGAVLALLALGAAAAAGLVDRPADWRSAGVVVGASSGTTAVVAHGPDRLVPVPNLASARLVAAALAADGAAPSPDAAPVTVPDAVLDAVPRDRAVGIPDAPALPAPGAAVPPVWSVCDTVGPGPGSPPTTAVIAADRVPGRPLAGPEGLLLRDRTGATWLVHDGIRSRIDPGDPAVVGALRLGGQVPRPVSAGLLAVLPEGPAVTPPVLAGRGGPGPPGLPGETVGGVLRLVVPAAGDRYLVVERGGVQEVPALVAGLVRLADPARAGVPVPTVRPAQVAATPVAREIPLAAYPSVAPAPVAPAAAPTTCAGGRAGDAAVPTVAAAAPAAPTVPAGADGPGDRVDAVALPGSGAFVRGVGPGGVPGPLAVVGGSGAVSVVPDPATAARLGLGTSPPPVVPGPVLDLLPRGPTLDAATALTPLP